MTDEKLIALVREIADPETEDPVNNGMITLTLEEMRRFADQVTTAERERCIEACEASYHWINGPEGWLKYAVEAIQSRGDA